jgi:hypothetical protein
MRAYNKEACKAEMDAFNGCRAALEEAKSKARRASAAKDPLMGWLFRDRDAPPPVAAEAPKAPPAGRPG